MDRTAALIIIIPKPGFSKEIQLPSLFLDLPSSLQIKFSLFPLPPSDGVSANEERHAPKSGPCKEEDGEVKPRTR